MSRVTPPTLPPIEQIDSYATINSPVSGTYYEWRTGLTGAGASLGTLKNVRIIWIAANCTWTVQTALSVRVTKDGKTVVHSVALPVSTTGYYAEFALANWGAEDNALSTTNYSRGGSFLFEGRDVKIEVATTGGTVSNMKLQVKYARYI